MDKAQIITLVLGSAAIGAFVSSVVTLFGQWRERKSRREEIVLTEAVKLAEMNMNATLNMAKARAAVDKDTRIVPMIEMVRDYHEWLRGLLDTGRLPDSYRRTGEPNSRQR
jgi:hypothetical protein